MVPARVRAMTLSSALAAGWGFQPQALGKSAPATLIRAYQEDLPREMRLQ
jgi:hypothetical protein